MKNLSIRMLTWLLVLVMALGCAATAETTEAVITTVQAQSAAATFTAAAEYLGEMLNLSVQTGTDEDGCQQIAITAPGLEDTLLVQIGETAVVVRYGENALELSYDVLSEALSLYSYMASGLDAETAKSLYAYVNGGDAQQDEIVLNSVLNTEVNRLLALVIERGLLTIAEDGFEINATAETVVAMLAEYLTRAAADEQLAASLSQLKMWGFMGTDAQTGTQALLAQMTAAAQALTAQPLTGISGSLQVSMPQYGPLTAKLDLTANGCTLQANLTSDDNGITLDIAHEADGARFALTGALNEEGMNVEFRKTQTGETLWEGSLKVGEDDIGLEIKAADGDGLLFSLTKESYGEYRASFALSAGSFALNADVHTDYDLFELEASLKAGDASAHLSLSEPSRGEYLASFSLSAGSLALNADAHTDYDLLELEASLKAANTAAHLTLTAEDDDVDGALTVSDGRNYLTLSLYGRDDVFTLNGVLRTEDENFFSLNATFIETYRGAEGSFRIDGTDSDGVMSIYGTMAFESDRYAYEYTVLENGVVTAHTTYELTSEGVKTETIGESSVTRGESVFEYTETGMNITTTSKTFFVDEDGTETEFSSVYMTLVIDGVNFVCDMSVKSMVAEEAIPYIHYTGTAVEEENRIAYRIDMDILSQMTMSMEAGVIREEPEHEDEVRGRLYLSVSTTEDGESRIDLPFSVTLTESMTEVRLALESTENGVTESVGSLSLKAEITIPETAPAHVTGTPITAEQLLQLFAQ